MQGKFVNIPRKCKDEHYRYQMPVVELKVEGKGNGIRTVISNMEAVMKALDRDPEIGMRFLGIELGASTKCDNKKCVINGKYDEVQINAVLDKFIDQYVLCNKCNNPETNLAVKGDTVGKLCKACGYRGKAASDSAITKHIAASYGKGKSKDKINNIITPKKANINVANDTDCNEWSLDTSSVAVRQRQQKLNVDGSNNESNVYPQEKFIQYLANWPDVDSTAEQIQQLMVTQGMSETIIIKYTFASLFSPMNLNNDIKTDFYRKIDYLSALVKTEKDQAVVMMCIEKFIESNVNCCDDISSILNGFWESGCIEENTILRWHKSKSKHISEKLANEIRIKSNVFINWLHEAELDEQAIEY